MRFLTRFIVYILLSVVSLGFSSALFASGGGQCNIVGDDIAQTLKDCSRGTAGIDAGEF